MKASSEPLYYWDSRQAHSLRARLFSWAVQMKKRWNGDRFFVALLVTSALGLIGLFAGIGLFLLMRSIPSIKAFGLVFAVTSLWDPVKDVYGALPVVYGTLVSSALSLMIAGPFSVAIAMFLTELAPRRLGAVLGFLIEMLAAIPSVVIGLWGIFVLAPILRETIYPFLSKYLGFIPLFSGPSYGVGLMTSGMILSIMILPTITSLCREVFKAVPRDRREAAIALGATKWETIWIGVLESSRAGISAAVILGLGRALGETMAVTMVIGNRAQIVASLLAPSQTMASVIANEYAEATSDLHLAALGEVGLLLFVVTIVVNGIARLFVRRIAGKARTA